VIRDLPTEEVVADDMAMGQERLNLPSTNTGARLLHVKPSSR